MLSHVFPPQEFCLACQGCCRFQDSWSPWRPKVYSREDKIFSSVRKFLNPEADGYVPAKCVQGHWLCDHLDPATNRCQVYPWRPLECLLYPFLLIENGNTIMLAVHWACPFIQEKKDSPEFKGACDALRVFFAQNPSQEFLRSCRGQIASSHIKPEEIEILFPLLIS